MNENQVGRKDSMKVGNGVWHQSALSGTDTDTFNLRGRTRGGAKSWRAVKGSVGSLTWLCKK
jgi:hypothetical protein